MKLFTLLERADLIKMLYENMSSIIRTKCAFRKKYLAKTLRDLAKKFENNGSITDSADRGIIRIICTIEKIAQVK